MPIRKSPSLLTGYTTPNGQSYKSMHMSNIQQTPIVGISAFFAHTHKNNNEKEAMILRILEGE